MEINKTNLRTCWVEFGSMISISDDWMYQSKFWMLQFQITWLRSSDKHCENEKVCKPSGKWKRPRNRWFYRYLKRFLRHFFIKLFSNTFIAIKCPFFQCFEEEESLLRKFLLQRAAEGTNESGVKIFQQFIRSSLRANHVAFTA